MCLLSVRVNVNMADMQEGVEQTGAVTMKERRGRRDTAVTQPFPGQRNKQLNTSRVLTCFSCSQVADKTTEKH